MIGENAIVAYEFLLSFTSNINFDASLLFLLLSLILKVEILKPCISRQWNNSISLRQVKTHNLPYIVYIPAAVLSKYNFNEVDDN